MNRREKRVAILGLTMMVCACSAYSQTSVSSGYFTDPNTWSTGTVPQQGDDVIIEHFVYTGDRLRVNNLTVRPGGYMWSFGNQNTRIDGDLKIEAGGYLNTYQNSIFRGAYDVDGAHYSNYTIQLRNDNEIKGSGLVYGNFDFYLNNCSRTIPADATISFEYGQIRISQNQTITNYGNVTVAIVTANDASGNWINKTNSSVKVMNGFSVLSLDCSEPNNEIIFNTEIGVDLLLLDPVNSQFWDLTIEGNDLNTRRVVQDYTEILGDLTINNASLSCWDGFSEVFDVHGDWINNNGTFVPSQSTVNFKNTTTPQLISSVQKENFYNATIDPGVNTYVNNDIIVYNDLVIKGTFDLNNGGDFDINLGGDLAATNAWDLHSNKMTLDGNNLQSLDAELNIFDLELNNSAGATLNNKSLELINFMEMTQGSFYTNNLLELRSTADRTAGIGAISPGDAVVGDVVYHRFFAPSLNGWGQLSVPIENKTWKDLDDDMFTTGFTNADYYYEGWVNIRKYDETYSGDLNEGFYPISALEETISPTEGHFVFYAAGDVALDVTGTINQQDYSYNLNYTANGDAGNIGWNLLSNPYPCSIDWASNTGWVKSGVNQSVYIYNASTNQYSSYINGIGINGGSRYIPSGQAYWIRTNNAGASLTIGEQAKVNEQVSYRSSEVEAEYFTLALQGSGLSDQLAIAIQNGATEGFDVSSDAVKLFAGVDAINICSRSNDGYFLSINSIGGITEELVVPLEMNVPQLGTYSILPERIASFSSASCIKLLDSETDEEYALMEGVQFELEFTELTNPERFVLVFGSSFEINTVSPSCHNGADATASVSEIEANDFSVTWQDASGNTIANSSALVNVAPGVYAATIAPVEEGCPSQTIAFEISPTQEMQTSAEVGSPKCAGGQDGSAFVEINNGTAPFLIDWSNGEEDFELQNLSAGTLSYVVTDANGCQIEAEITLDDGALLSTEISSTDPNCEMSADGTTSLNISGGQAPYSVLWNTGSSNQALEALSAGEYVAFVQDANGCESETSVVLVNGEAPVAIAQMVIDFEPEFAFVQFTNQSTIGDYMWDFGDGTTSIEESPAHEFEIGSIYEVQLTVRNGACESTIYMEVNTIIESVEDFAQDQFSAQRISENTIRLNMPTFKKYEVFVLNLLGQEIEQSRNINEDVDVLDIQVPSAGVVLLQIRDENGNTWAKKIGM